MQLQDIIITDAQCGSRILPAARPRMKRQHPDERVGVNVASPRVKGPKKVLNLGHGRVKC